MTARIVALVAAAGCGFPTPSEDFACTSNADCASHPGTVCGTSGFCVEAADGGADAPFDCTVWPAPAHFDPCAIPPPGGALDLSMPGTYRYDTTTKTLTAPDGGTSQPPHQVVAGAQLISIDALQIGASASLRVVGDKPLIVAAWSRIDVVGTLDASSAGGALGAGANGAGCATATAGGNASGGGGGGGGGGFQGMGGSGGKGNGTTAGGLGGNAVAIPMLAGGCRGAKGGDGSTAGAQGGDGGGAVQLTARDTITITGVVHAGGAGGRGATTTLDDSSSGPGGGGGGSGGMIGLEAPIVTGSGTLAANGGGGGEGADSSAGQLPGANGADGAPGTTSASGGAQNVAGNGGTGSAGAQLAGGLGVDDATDGGGGGGGGAGYIFVRSADRSLTGPSSPALLPP